MPIDYAKAQKLCTRYRGKLTRLQRKADHAGIVALWSEFQRAFEAIDAPLPDDWRRWERAAEDSAYALERGKAGLR